MDRTQKIIISVFAAILAVIVITIIIVAAGDKAPIIGDFIPPPFEENAVKGIPDPLPDFFGTLAISEELIVGVCATPSLKENALDIYLTSHEKNISYVKIRIYDKKGEILGESGLLKPGEHLRSLELSAPIPSGENELRAIILSYEPDTYYSKGSAEIVLKIKA